MPTRPPRFRLPALLLSGRLARSRATPISGVDDSGASTKAAAPTSGQGAAAAGRAGSDPTGKRGAGRQQRRDDRPPGCPTLRRSRWCRPRAPASARSRSTRASKRRLMEKGAAVSSKHADRRRSRAALAPGLLQRSMAPSTTRGPSPRASLLGDGRPPHRGRAQALGHARRTRRSRPRSTSTSPPSACWAG
jgi:hypothetical protein